MPVWRNWQTHQIQDLVFYKVQVQVLSPAPNGDMVESADTTDFGRCTKKFVTYAKKNYL